MLINVNAGTDLVRQGSRRKVGHVDSLSVGHAPGRLRPPPGSIIPVYNWTYLVLQEILRKSCRPDHISANPLPEQEPDQPLVRVALV